MPTPIEKTPEIPPTFDEERMKNIFLLLEHLFKREDVTVKLVLEYLYDVGSVRIIDKNIHMGCLNRSLKSVAQMSKPVFKIAGLYWFQRNCPKLITDWLYSLVVFEDQTPIDNSQLELQLKEQEIQRLKTRERLLAAVSVGAIAAGGWLGYQLQIERSQLEPATFRSTSEQPCLANITARD
jgi:hypothetical protein